MKLGCPWWTALCRSIWVCWRTTITFRPLTRVIRPSWPHLPISPSRPRSITCPQNRVTFRTTRTIKRSSRYWLHGSYQVWIAFNIMLFGDIFDRVGKSVTLTVLSFTSVLTQWLQHTWKLIYFSNMCIKTAFSISHKWINYIIHTYFRNTESTWKMNKPKDYSAVGLAVAYYQRLMVC